MVSNKYFKKVIVCARLFSLLKRNELIRGKHHIFLNGHKVGYINQYFNNFIINWQKVKERVI